MDVEVNNGTIDEGLYSRQLYVMGREGQARMQVSRECVWGAEESRFLTPSFGLQASDVLIVGNIGTFASMQFQAPASMTSLEAVATASFSSFTASPLST